MLAHHVLKVDNKHVAVRKEFLGTVLTQTHCRMKQGGQCQLQAAALHLQGKFICQDSHPLQIPEGGGTYSYCGLPQGLCSHRLFLTYLISHNR